MSLDTPCHAPAQAFRDYIAESYVLPEAAEYSALRVKVKMQRCSAGQTARKQ